jgi:hypothetical protein
MDDDKATSTSDEIERGSEEREESWLAEQARLVLLEDGN